MIAPPSRWSRIFVPFRGSRRSRSDRSISICALGSAASLRVIHFVHGAVVWVIPQRVAAYYPCVGRPGNPRSASRPRGGSMFFCMFQNHHRCHICAHKYRPMQETLGPGPSIDQRSGSTPKTSCQEFVRAKVATRLMSVFVSHPGLVLSGAVEQDNGTPD